MAGVDRAELLQAIANLQADIERKFEQIRADSDGYARDVRASIDKLSEHISDHRVRIATGEQKVQFLEQAVYGRRQTDKPLDDAAPALTMGDVKRVGVLVTVGTAIGAGMLRVWTWLHAVK